MTIDRVIFFRRANVPRQPCSPGMLKCALSPRTTRPTHLRSETKTIFQDHPQRTPAPAGRDTAVYLPQPCCSRGQQALQWPDPDWRRSERWSEHSPGHGEVQDWRRLYSNDFDANSTRVWEECCIAGEKQRGSTSHVGDVVRVMGAILGKTTVGPSCWKRRWSTLVLWLRAARDHGSGNLPRPVCCCEGNTLTESSAKWERGSGRIVQGKGYEGGEARRLKRRRRQEGEWGRMEAKTRHPWFSQTHRLGNSLRQWGHLVRSYR